MLILLVTQSVMVCGISISAASLPSPARTTVPNEAAVFQIDEEESQEEVMNWLRQQQLEVSIAQANLIQKLRDFQIPVGLPPGSLRKQSEANADDLSQRIITSLPDNHIECRVTLDRVPFGRKCVAPCQCTGSQKWVQFAVLNKLRRKDAQAWVTCPTCRTPYRYDLLLAQSDFKSSLLSTALDNISVVRSVVAGVVVISALKMGVHHLLLRFLLSRSFWQQVRVLVSIVVVFGCCTNHMPVSICDIVVPTMVQSFAFTVGDEDMGGKADLGVRMAAISAI